MITILEGPDGAGKSTLAHQLTYDRIDHHGPYPGEEQIAWRYLRSIVRGRSRDVIMDRSWISEPIYGEAKKRPNRISTAARRMLERSALGSSAVSVWCLPSYNTCLTNWRARWGQEYLDRVEDLRDVYHLYRQADMENPHVIPAVSWDYEDEDGIGACVDAIENTRHVNRGSGIGAWKPGEVALIVGDAGSHSVKAGYPFVSFMNAGCGAWFTMELERMGYAEDRFYWLNTHDRNWGSIRWGRFIEDLDPRVVIALGNETSIALTARRVLHAKVQHPQHVKRFGGSDAQHTELEAILGDTL